MAYRSDFEAALARVDALERQLEAALADRDGERVRADELDRELVRARAEVERLRRTHAVMDSDVDAAPTSPTTEPATTVSTWKLAALLGANVVVIVTLLVRGFPGYGIVAFGTLGVLLVIPLVAAIIGFGTLALRRLHRPDVRLGAAGLWYLAGALVYFVAILFLHELRSELVAFRPATDVGPD